MSMDDGSGDESSHGEQVVFTLRTHPKVLVGPVAALLALSLVAMLVGSLIPAGGILGWLRLVLWLACAVLAAIWVVRPVMAWFSTVFTVTTVRIQRRRGLLVRRGLDLPLSRVANIATERGLLDRLFGCGTLLVRDASSSRGLAMLDVPRVLEVREAISSLVHAAHSGAPVPPELLSEPLSERAGVVEEHGGDLADPDHYR